MKIKNEGKSTSFCMWAAILWTGLTFYASIMSSNSVKSFSSFHFKGIDKIAHFTLYFVFAILWWHALSYIYNKKVIWLVLVISIAFGIAMELLQLFFFLDRSFEVSDIIANIIGSFVGVSILNRTKFIKLC